MSHTLVYLGRPDGQPLGPLAADCDAWPIGEKRTFSDERAAEILDLNRGLDTPIIGVIEPEPDPDPDPAPEPTPKPSRSKAAAAAPESSTTDTPADPAQE